MMISPGFWEGKKVFITGSTGFKGAWLSLWLCLLKAKVTGFALGPPTQPSLYELCKIGQFVQPIIGDVRDYKALEGAMSAFSPDIVIHMAAQSLVGESYKYPMETYATNVIGTVNVLESVRKCTGVKAVINVTSDKCYDNREWLWGYRENDALGGYDPYSNSKACSELVTSAYRNSFFNPDDYHKHGVALASVRSGNVIGGGDWACGRLIPDCVRAMLEGQKLTIRNPQAVRPWQHVLEPLCGYLLLAEKLFMEGPSFAEAWNFGPDEDGIKSVEWVVRKFYSMWGSGGYVIDAKSHPHESGHLKLDTSKAKAALAWYPRWRLEKSIDSILEWLKVYRDNRDVTEICFKQIEEYSDQERDGL